MAHSVYGLIDPRNQRLFYIGYSSKLSDRLVAHHNTGSNDCWSALVMKELEDLDLRVEHCILGEFDSKKEALELEKKLIRLLPNTVNLIGKSSDAYKFMMMKKRMIALSLVEMSD